MAVATMEMVARRGIPTHLIRFIPPRTMEVQLVRVLDPARGELSYGERNCLIPLQVIYRNMLPENASVFRRLESGTVTLAQLGLSQPPKPNDRLENALIEFTTKLEEIDRFVSEMEAKSIARLTDLQFAEVKRLTLAINELVTSHAAARRLVHADGKVEFGIRDDGVIMLVDAVGTADDNRFLYNGAHVTKQVLRDFYLIRGLERDVQQWAAEGRPRKTWPVPEHLPVDYVEAVADMYKAVSDLWTGEKNWNGPSLRDVVDRLDALRLAHVT
jgi:phosphoribosylaminoimidazole-succinocarboxamide synthase